ncbi:MAG: hypothetical protein A2137_04435, partial [Chloroflexi bacterium RBG_16_58_8]
MAFKYIASTVDNKIVNGTVDVASESQAEAAIYRDGYRHIISLKKVSPAFNAETLIPSIFGVRPQEIIEFTGQLATLLKSGVSIVTALNLLGGQAPRAALRKIVNGLLGEIQGGSSFSQALSRYPMVFPDAFVKLVNASEQAGNLETGLRHAEVYLEAQEQSKRKIKRAMAYPVFVLLLAGAVSILLITVVLPPLVQLFSSLGSELPWMTRWLLGMTGFILEHRVQALAALVAAVIVIVALSRLPAVKLAADRLRLRLPLFRSITIERSMQHFCQTASMLLKAGLRLPQILEITVGANRNHVLRQAFDGVRDRLVQGEGLSQPMSENRLFPPLMVEMTAVGEKSGALDETL